MIFKKEFLFMTEKNEQEKHNETVVAHVTAEDSLQPIRTDIYAKLNVD